MAENPRTVREKIYNVFRCKQPFLVCNNQKALGLLGGVPSETERERNFRLLIEQNFAGTGILEMSSSHWPVEKRNEKITAFQYLHKYALTPYGGVMVARILVDNKKNTNSENRFSIGIKDNDQATGGYNFILLPSDFPRLKNFPGSILWVDPLAVIHHEFGHTKFDSRNTKPHSISLDDERKAVIYHENPVRMLNGMEPRYTYTKEGMTINIITGEKKPGLLTFSPNNPAVLVRL